MSFNDSGMSTKFALGGLARLLTQAIRSGGRTLVFEVCWGKGRFVFMMFLAEEDKESRDKLFVFLRHTKVLLELGLYGSYTKGSTHTYLKPHDVRAMIAELRLSDGSGVPFDFGKFLLELNGLIPPAVTWDEVVDSLRRVWPEAKSRLSNVVDDASKTSLIGIRRLPVGKSPREKTLRKLYVNTTGGTAEIKSLIRSLQAARVTLVWSADPNAVSMGFADIASAIAMGNTRPAHSLEVQEAVSTTAAVHKWSEGA